MFLSLKTKTGQNKKELTSKNFFMSLFSLKLREKVISNKFYVITTIISSKP